MIENQKRAINSSKGFSLVELMVSLAIIGILASMAVVNISRNNDRDVRAERDSLISFLREVQNKALAGDKAGITLDPNQRLCGYGVYWVSDTNLRIYYRVATGLDTDCALSVPKTYDATRTLGDYLLKNNVRVGSFSEIFFLSPDSKVYSGGSVLVGTIPISLSKGSVVLNPAFSVDSAGRIYY